MIRWSAGGIGGGSTRMLINPLGPVDTRTTDPFAGARGIVKEFALSDIVEPFQLIESVTSVPLMNT